MVRLIILRLKAEDLVDQAIDLKYIGGCYGGLRKPSNFICLVLKLLQIAPQKEIVYALIENSNYKYVRALGMFYLRMIGRPEEVYVTLEKMYSDSRKIVERKQNGEFEIIHIDVLADKLLNDEILYDIVLPRVTHRDILEEMGKLEPRISPLEEELEQIMAEEEAEKQKEELEGQEDNTEDREREKKKKKKKDSKKRSRSRSREKKEKKKKKKWKKILKKKRKERKRKEEEEEKKSEKKKKPVEGSVEYWNEIRANLGLSQLKKN